MIIVLKIILALIAAADVLVFRFLLKDYQTTRKQEGYDDLSIWRRLRFNITTYFIMSSMIALFVFLVYFIVIRINLV